MSRVEKFGSKKMDREGLAKGRKASAKREETPVFDLDSEDQLPPRTVKYPSNRYKLSYWFYRFLILLFIALVIGLLLWGKQKYGL